MDFKKEVFALHKKSRGKLEITPTIPLKNERDLALAYTPGVAVVSRQIFENPNSVWDLTIKNHTIAVVTDGSAVLGLGNIGPLAALPVMEGKCVLLKIFAGLDAFPICLDTQNSKEIISAIYAIAPSFGGIILEDIAAPRCFEIEGSLQDIGIPLMHDDQHGTATVVLAGLLNGAKVVGKNLKKMKVAVLGAGAAGSAIAKILAGMMEDVIVVDSKGIVSRKRTDLDNFKKQLAKITNKTGRIGNLRVALKGIDVVVGVSRKGLIKADDIKLMNPNPIVFALANPEPEIYPIEAKKGGAFIVATGRSDFSNQINNCLAFPGIFKGALRAKARQITTEMKIAAALALAGMIKNPRPDKIIPSPFAKGVTDIVARAVEQAARQDRLK